MLISYDDIPTISEEVAKEIEKEAVWVCRASQLDKFTLSKFYFDCHFYHMDNEDRAFIWDNRCRNFFDNYDCEIIKKIIKDNKIKHISELNLNDLVISNDTNNYIKNNYASTIKNINQRLIKVINLVLGCQVIESVSKSAKSKATKYEFTELYNALDEINEKYKNPFDNNAFLD
jgi:hypothetical protein